MGKVDSRFTCTYWRKKKVPSVLLQGWHTGFYKFPKGECTKGVCHFNPSIADIAGKTYLFTRREVGAGTTGRISSISVWRTNPSHNLTLHSILDMPRTLERESWEDPRIFTQGSRSWLSCTFWSPRAANPPAQAVAQISSPKLDMLSKRVIPEIEHNSEVGEPAQKNWTFFTACDRRTFLLYMISPMHVIEVDKEWRSIAAWKSSSAWHTSWRHGSPRGGTPPLEHRGEFVVFFHSSLPWKGQQRRYHMGAMTFSIEPPFTPLRFTPKPLLSGSEDDPRTLNGPCVVFPCGAVKRPSHYLITYGVNDEACAWMELPYDALDQKLVKI